MPDIKHQFSSGKMNKDLDERIVPNGEYRDAMNIQVSTSEGSNVGTAQNILGNLLHHNSNFVMPNNAVTVATIGDEKNDYVYWFVHGSNKDCILRKSVNNKNIEAVFVDFFSHPNRSDAKRVLGFGNEGTAPTGSADYVKQITGINILDDLLFWTDNYGEPKKINISRSIAGTGQTGTAHTWLVNEDTGNVTTTPIEEKHVCVIKRGPSTPLALHFNTIKGRDDSKQYSGIINVTDDPGTLANTSSLFVPGNIYTSPPIANVNNNYDFSSYQIGDIIYMSINTDINGNPDFTLEWNVGDTVVIKEFDDDGIAPTTPLRDYRIKGKIVEFQDPIALPADVDATNFTQDTSGSYGASSANFTVWGIDRSKVAVQIESINGFPPSAIGGFGAGNLNYVIDLFDDETKLYEFKFPRFSYRYKYEDGEYSIFAPWSEVAFLPSAFDNHPQKGYNLGMTNKIQDILLEGLVPFDIPLDVVEVDILYKEDTSTNVYVVETISPKDTPKSSIAGAINDWELGSYYLTSETIKSLTPSNQLLRSWDYVPRKALSQEVTGNRIVYANYLQQFNLREGNPNDNNLPYWQPKFEISIQQKSNSIPNPIKTIKSLREYQLGVVFVDAYGRETPVLSNNTGSIKLDKSYALTGNQLSVSFKNPTGPNNMAYFKFYVKETSGEYYNMAMDRFYDAADGNVWLAFSSSDRNKLDIDTFLILKKGTGADNIVSERARYKVLAIENEAPDYVKTTKLLVSTKVHTTTGSGATDIFGNTMVGAPETGGYKFKVKYEPFYSDSGGDLHNLIQPGVELWVDFRLASEDEVSDRYRITSIKCDYEVGGNVSMSDSYYYITIDGLFNDDVNFITDDPTGAASTKILETAEIRFWKYAVENRPQFDGRFFVKIYNDGTFNRYVTKDFDTASANDYRIMAKKPIYLLDESMHDPSFAGGSIQIWNSVQDLGPGQAPHYAVGLPTYSGLADPSFFTQVGTGEYNTFYDYYNETPAGPAPHNTASNVQAAGAMDPTRQGGITTGWWRKTQFWAWFVDFHWKTTSANFLGNSLASIANLGADLDITGTNGHFHTGDGFEWTAQEPGKNGDDIYKPDKKHETWFIDNGKYRGRNLIGNEVGTLSSGYNKMGDHPEGGWTGGGIENYHSPDYCRINLSFGPIWSEDPFSNSEHFNIGDGSPNYPHQADFVNRMKPGAQFRWKEDPTQTVYTVGPNLREWNINRYVHPVETGASALDGVGRNDSAAAYPANFNKYYYLHVTPKMGNVWDPTKNPLGPIDGGHNITLPISAGSSSSMTGSTSTVDNCWIMLDSIVGTDVDNGNIEAQLRPGMIVTEYVSGGSTYSMPATPSTHSGELAGQYLVISEIEYVTSLNKYKVYLVGYKWPLKSIEIPGNIGGPLPNAFEPGANVTFRQASMNMVSPTYCDNYEKMQSQQNNFNGYGVGSIHSRNTMYAVGYTLEWIERVDREEVMPDFPAVWETEPKEQPELDIYYEVGGLHPLTTDSANVGLSKTSLQTLFSYNSIVTEKGVPTIIIDPLTVDNVILDPLGAVGPVFTNNSWVVLNGTTTSTAAATSSGDDLTNAPFDIVVEKPDGTTVYPISIDYIIDAYYLNPGTYPTLNKSHALRINASESDLAFRSSAPRKVRFNLPYFNAYSFANGVESNRIRDNFNLPYILNGVKASTTLAEQYKEERRETGLIYSGIYNSITGVNNLNQFIQAEKITKDINPTYGSIQKLFSRDTDLVTFCEDKVLKILANKDAVFNADGDPQLVATSNVLGQTIPFSGDYGISKNPESFASESYRAYFTDKQRSVVLRLSQDGLTPISDYGMKDWFKDALNIRTGDSLSDYGGTTQEDVDVNILGNYDTRNNEYNLKIGFTSEQTGGSPFKTPVVVSFKEENKGWISFKSFVEMENGLSVSDKYFTFKGGKAYFHNSHDVDRNTFYGQYAESSITVLLNDDPGSVKTFNTFNYEGSQSKVNKFVEYTDSLGFNHTDKDFYNLSDKDGWYMQNIQTDMQDGAVHEFINKENKWFNYIKGIQGQKNSASHLSESEFSFQGLGTAGSFFITAIVPGCTDPAYVEYNPSATTDDGSCVTIAVPGCMNSSATNYNSNANVDDGSCLIVGCTDPTMFNDCTSSGCNVPCQDILGVSNGTSGGTCCIPIQIGCMTANVINGPAATPDYSGNCADASMTNVWQGAMSGAAAGACYTAAGGPYPGYDVFSYNPNANTPGTCTPLPTGCTDSTASNYTLSSIIGVIDDGSCLYEGCTDPAAFNYNPLWTTDDGSCCYNAGCTDSTALNYDPAACYDDGSCIACVYGCMDTGDSNYDSNATCHDCANYCNNSCGCNDPNAANYDSTKISNDGSCVYAGCLDPTAINQLQVNGIPVSCLDVSAIYTSPANYIGGASQECGPLPSQYNIMTGISGSIMDGVYGGNPQTMFNTCTYIIQGCMLPVLTSGPFSGLSTFNFDPSANTPCNSTGLPGDAGYNASNDNDCCYQEIVGCMDPLALNYVAPIGDVSVDINTPSPNDCCYVSGCTDPAATNYNANACQDDGSCNVPIFGCMDNTTGLHNTAGANPGHNNLGFSSGFTSATLCNDPSYVTDQFNLLTYVAGSGCIDPSSGVAWGFSAINYDPEATACPGGTSGPYCGCNYKAGCTDSTMYNYDPSAATHITYGVGQGCMDSSAANYDATATTDNGTCCYPIIEGCLHENFTNLNGDEFENYNHGSGSLGNPYDVQGWSQYKVTPTGNIGFDVNTHDQTMCIPKDGTATTHTTNANTASPLHGERNGAGCVDNLGSDSNTVDYWWKYHQNINSAGPYNFNNSDTRVFTITIYHGQAITNSNTHPFNYNENWTEFATLSQNSFSSSVTWPIETDFYDDNTSTQFPSTNTVVDGGGNINKYGSFNNWDPAVQNSCCRTSGCLHPYALNFDAAGYLRNPSSPMDPIYVGVGVQKYNPATGQIHIMQKANQDAPGGPSNPYDQIGPATSTGGLSYAEGGRACQTCTGDPAPVSGYQGGTIGDDGERFQKFFNNGFDENGNYTGNFSPKNRCGGSGYELWEMADDTSSGVGASAAATAAQASGCLDWRIDNPTWSECCVFPLEYSGNYNYDANANHASNPCFNGNSTTNLQPMWVAPNQRAVSSCLGFWNEPDMPDVMFGGCTNPNACNVPQFIPGSVNTPNPAYNNGKKSYHQSAMWDDGSCCFSVPVNQGGTGDCSPCDGTTTSTTGTGPAGPIGGAPLSTASWDCVTNSLGVSSCVDPGNGNGQFNTLAACQTACTSTPPPSWNCVGTACVDPGDGNGQYSSLVTCQNFCTPSTTGGTNTNLTGL